MTDRASGIDIERLKEVASNATPGPWNILEYYICRYFGPTLPMGEPIAWICGKWGEDNPLQDANAAYIAAASPDVVLAMIAKIERLEREKGDILTTAFMDALARLPKTLKDQASDQLCKIHELEYEISCLNKEAAWLAEMLDRQCHGLGGCNLCSDAVRKKCRNNEFPKAGYWREAARKAVEEQCEKR